MDAQPAAEAVGPFGIRIRVAPDGALPPNSLMVIGAAPEPDDPDPLGTLARRSMLITGLGD